MQKRIKTPDIKRNFRNSLIYHRKNKLDHKFNEESTARPSGRCCALGLRHIMTIQKDQKLNSWKKSAV